jgi:glutamate racemase
MKIGVFDSGLGGLSILKEMLRQLPEYDYIYLGDNARVPYGGRSEKIIYQFTQNAVDFLFKKNCQLIILACNTATATSLKKLQQEYLPKNFPDRRVLGIIKPAVEFLQESKFDRVGVIGTYATIESQAFLREIKKILPKTKVFQQACPLLVPIIEEGEINWIGLKLILKKYLEPLKKQKIDSLILGCTHYSLIKKQIRAVIGSKIKIICEAEQAALKLRKYLQNHSELEKKLSKKASREFYVTDLNKRYQKMANWFLGEKIDLNLVTL